MEKTQSKEEPQTLKDPYNDRVIKSVPLPYTGAATDKHVWPNGQSREPDFMYIKEFQKRNGLLTKSQFCQLIKDAIKIMKSEPN